MTLTQRNDINLPEAGLLIYQTDNNEGFYYFNGNLSIWKALNEYELPQGPNPGDMTYWNGVNWTLIPATINEGATLQMISGVPTWVGGTPPIVNIGDLIEGGVVFYIAPSPIDLDGDGDLDTGLVSAIEDQGQLQWFNGSLITTGASHIGIGTGTTNTRKIINIQGVSLSNYAAGLASLYQGGGYTDWFLPSKNQLKRMFNKKDDINVGSIASGGSVLTNTVYYWSSTEYDYSSAYAYKYQGDSSSIIAKNVSTYKIRAIRAF
jgi:hypothetical protein